MPFFGDMGSITVIAVILTLCTDLMTEKIIEPDFEPDARIPLAGSITGRESHLGSVTISPLTGRR